MSNIIELTTTIDSTQRAEELANSMIEARLAACVQITPAVRSVYRWEGKVCAADECKLTAKSTSELTDRLMQFVREHHAYDVPEILVSDVTTVSPDYEAWVRQSVA